MVQENKRLKANEAKAVKMLKESMVKMNELAATNSKLAYTTRLFTEHSTTKKEKVNILKKMDTAKTVRESELMFNMISEGLEKRVLTKKPNIVKDQITEGQKKTNIVKEERTYVDPEQQRLLDVMFYKPEA